VIDGQYYGRRFGVATLICKLTADNVRLTILKYSTYYSFQGQPFPSPMGKLSFWSFLSEQIRNLPLPKESANGRTIIVAGANIGLGLEASIHFGSKKPDLLIATCRDAAKCEQTLEGMVFFTPR
jgi:hypothetical protein